MSPKRGAVGLLLSLSVVLMAALAAAPAHAQTGTLTGIYSFTDGADGANPVGGVVADANGTLYGETSIGSAVRCTSKAQPSLGCGTVYSFSPTAGLKVLASFSGPNGAHGNNTLTLVGTTLYGTTDNGGASDDGVVFSVHTDGTAFTLLHQFDGTDGETPVGTMRVGPGNILYGLTAAGGSHNLGVLFSLKPDGTYAVLHNFAGGTDGREPNTILLSSSGILVGGTREGGTGLKKYCLVGCGIVFQYTISTASYKNDYSFTGQQGGGGWIGSLGAGPTVYGNYGYGVYSLTSGTGLTIISPFSSLEEGATGSGPLLAPDGSLIGVTGDGQIQDGTLYSVSGGVNTVLAFFGDDGTDPLAQPIRMPNGTLFGTASLDGLCADCGAIWEYTP